MILLYLAAVVVFVATLVVVSLFCSVAVAMLKDDLWDVPK